jgi:hypothetical protein
VVNLRRMRRAPPTDVVIELDNAAELFAVDPRGLLAGAHRIDSGMDELVERLLAQKEIAADQRVVLDIASECSDELAAEVVAAVRRYCELRMRRANREHDLIWRQGKRSLLSGSLLFGPKYFVRQTKPEKSHTEATLDESGNEETIIPIGYSETGAGDSANVRLELLSPWARNQIGISLIDFSWWGPAKAIVLLVLTGVVAAFTDTVKDFVRSLFGRLSRLLGPRKNPETAPDVADTTPVVASSGTESPIPASE